MLFIIGIASYFFEFSVPHNFSFEAIGENRFGFILILTGIMLYLFNKRTMAKNAKDQN